MNKKHVRFGPSRLSGFRINRHDACRHQKHAHRVFKQLCGQLLAASHVKEL